MIEALWIDDLTPYFDDPCWMFVLMRNAICPQTASSSYTSQANIATLPAHTAALGQL